MESKYETAAETAKKIRQTLKKMFPGVKFSVTSSTYSGGSSVDVAWTDGPLTAAVDKVIQGFSSTSFDGMTDSTSHHGYSWIDEQTGKSVKIHGAGYVFSHRRRSDALKEKLVGAIKAKWGPEAGQKIVEGPDMFREMNIVEAELATATEKKEVA